jgi:GGDEF domain-containing protein
MQVIRSYDFVGRYGGEESLVVLPGCDRIHAFQSAERIRCAVAAAPSTRTTWRFPSPPASESRPWPPKFAKSSFSPSLTLIVAYTEPELVSLDAVSETLALRLEPSRPLFPINKYGHSKKTEGRTSQRGRRFP